jgi:hypothetical protein
MTDQDKKLDEIIKLLKEIEKHLAYLEQAYVAPS